MIVFGVGWKTCLAFIDDLVILSQKSCQKLKNVDEVQTLLCQPAIALKLRKCHFYQKEVENICKILIPDCSAADSNIIKAVKTAVFPADTIQISSCLRSCSVYRRLMKIFPKLSHLLCNYLRKDKNLNWSDLITETLDGFNVWKLS